jgi:prepilin-type N-terminal cleavage/methylation domain-containing protein
MKKQNSGFTLVEIAIVLVIIGLLIGGVLKGQEMINNAKLKRIVSDFEGVAAAIFSYQDRYRSLPGDDSGAGRWSGVPVGNGNGVIQGNWNSNNANNESRRFWQHLRNSNLIPGDTGDTAQPKNAYGGVTGVMTNNYGMSGIVICMAGIDGSNAQIIDTQIDDGAPGTGTVRGNTTAVTGAGSASYAAGSTYNVCRKI